jgi:hypothetical protein
MLLLLLLLLLASVAAKKHNCTAVACGCAQTEDNCGAACTPAVCADGQHCSTVSNNQGQGVNKNLNGVCLDCPVTGALGNVCGTSCPSGCNCADCPAGAYCNGAHKRSVNDALKKHGKGSKSVAKCAACPATGAGNVNEPCGATPSVCPANAVCTTSHGCKEEGNSGRHVCHD